MPSALRDAQRRVLMLCDLAANDGAWLPELLRAIEIMQRIKADIQAGM